MDWLRAFGRFFEQKIGLHRLGIILSVLIIAVAAVVLYRKLHNMNVSKVLTAMATVEYRDVAISALFVTLGASGPLRADQQATRPVPLETQNYLMSILADLGIGGQIASGIAKMPDATGLALPPPADLATGTAQHRGLAARLGAPGNDNRQPLTVSVDGARYPASGRKLYLDAASHPGRADFVIDAGQRQRPLDQHGAKARP